MYCPRNRFQKNNAIFRKKFRGKIKIKYRGEKNVKNQGEKWGKNRELG